MPIIISKTQKYLDFFLLHQRLLLQDCINLIWLHFNALTIYNMS